jgi:uncharacterized protein YkwD
MYRAVGAIVLVLLAIVPLATTGPVGKATVAVHGSGADSDPVQREVYSPVERAPKGNIAPNITDRAWINGVLSRVDLWREQHAAAPLVWSTTLAQYALDSANKCLLQHTGGPYVSNLLRRRVPACSALID